MRKDLFKSSIRAVILMTVACTTLTFGACSDDDDEDYSSSSSSLSSGIFTPGGQFAANSGTVYLTSAPRLEFSYTSGNLAQVKMEDTGATLTVAHDPLTFTGTSMKLKDVEQNSDGFITSLTKIDGDTISMTFSYDSGHLTNIVATCDSLHVDFTFSWSNDRITGVVNTNKIEKSDDSEETDDSEEVEYEKEEIFTYASFVYSDDANATLQYGTYIESIIRSPMDGIEMLFYLGYLGKAPTYHPSSIYIDIDGDGYSYQATEYYIPVINSDGSLKRGVSPSKGATYTFTYQQ